MTEIKKGDRVVWRTVVHTVLTEPFTHPHGKTQLVVLTSGSGLVSVPCDELKPALERAWAPLIVLGDYTTPTAWKETRECLDQIDGHWVIAHIWREKQPDGTYKFGVETK